MASTTEPLPPVLASPDQDRPRLDYAAWCKAQSDPHTKARAEFISVQLELAARGQTMPFEQKHTLGYRELNLLKAHRAFWDPAVRALAPSADYDRGFIELVKMPAAAWMKNAAALRALAPIRHLDLFDAKNAIRDLVGSGTLAGLRSLSLDNSGLTDADVAELAKSPTVSSLRWLSLAANRLTYAAAESIASSPHLKSLVFAEFQGNPVDPTVRYGTDGDMVASMWLPPEGEKLELAHGKQTWLYRGGPRIEDLIPNRFRV